MKKIITVLACLLLAICQCSRYEQLCEVRQSQVAPVAYLALSELKIGMGTDEVRGILGEPTETRKYTDGSEIWKYAMYQDCVKHLSIGAPTTTLKFLGGILLEWRVAGQ